MSLIVNSVFAAIQCEEPEPPEHGSVTGSVFTFGASVNYTCDPGYSIEGPSRRTCTQAGWSGQWPTCNGESPSTCPLAICKGFKKI